MKSSTPWNRRATYQIPAGMPKCPKGGCTCAHLWVPKGCGQGNMCVPACAWFGRSQLIESRYMQGFKCEVTGEVGQKKLAKARAPVWCSGDQSKCRKGAKQMIVFNRKFPSTLTV